ncbi:MAG: TIGR04348 family glycosyltransferase [Planctomycetes bacterium]|nr:TIGR04348 family glycosyltransferase [Planctomycetota bacterium]
MAIVTPAPRGSRAGNRTTALRWAGLLRQLGATVRVVDRWQGERCDLLVAVHAVKTMPSVHAAAAALPGLRIVVLLAGTDIYPTFQPEPDVLRALERADALVGLQPHATATLPPNLQPKVRTIVQSATASPRTRAAGFRACVLAHLRPVKDPLLPIVAMAHVPATVPCELHLAGRALTDELAAAVRAAEHRDPRVHWHGELSRREAKDLLASSHACIVPSAAEGGANVVSEAIAAGTPVLATAIPGNLGLLGADWPATFPVGDARALAALLVRTATDRPFAAALHERVARLQPAFAPASERAAWRRLLADLGLDGTPGTP